MMQELYTDAYRQSVRSQLSRRLIPLCVVSVLLLGVIVWSFVVRMQVVTIAALLLLGSILIFSLDLFCKPLWQYNRFLSAALEGRNHTGTLIFDHPESDLSVVDGVTWRSLVFLGDPDKHGVREQKYYWDSQLPLPPFSTGETVTIRYTGKMIIAYEEH